MTHPVVTAPGRARTPFLPLTALGPDGAYETRNRRTISAVSGERVAELSLVPALYMSRAIAAMHRATTLPLADRLAALEAGGALFATGIVEGMTAAEYALTVCRMAGTPLASVQQAIDDLRRAAADSYRRAQAARPIGAVTDRHDPRTRAGVAAWTRRGDVLGVNKAGNHVGVHSLWLEALALGYRVAVRPSSRDPLTPYRLISAMRASGFGADQVMLLPTSSEAGDAFMRQVDLSMTFGTQDVVDRYGQDPRVLVNGPGRSKVLITADSDWREHIDVIVDSVAGEGGASCINASAVLVEGDPGPVAEALAGRLAEIPSLPPDDDRAVLPVRPLLAAQSLSDHLTARAAGTKAWLGGDGVADDLGDGSAVLRPAVYELDSTHDERVGVELPFPCVWVAPWTREAGVDVLKGSLVVTAITEEERLIDALLDEPSIKNLYVGDQPTHWTAPGVPHDGYLGDFLMRPKGFVRI